MTTRPTKGPPGTVTLTARAGGSSAAALPRSPAAWRCWQMNERRALLRALPRRHSFSQAVENEIAPAHRRCCSIPGSAGRSVRELSPLHLHKCVTVALVAFLSLLLNCSLLCLCSYIELEPLPGKCCLWLMLPLSTRLAVLTDYSRERLRCHSRQQPVDHWFTEAQKSTNNSQSANC